MLAAITKFFRERRRDEPQKQPPVAEEDGSSQPTSGVDAPPQSAEPEFEEPFDPPAQAKVKWFNPNKRYGFVELSDGSGDAFLHASVLARAGIGTLQPGETLELRIAPGERGPQVTEIISVDSSTAIALQAPRRAFAPPDEQPAPELTVQETGTVKWYSAAKGFGFIVRDGGGKDVFVHASALQRSGIVTLSEGQRVFIGIVERQKGPEAGSIQLA
jgi:CspA family cold shock protein